MVSEPAWFEGGVVKISKTNNNKFCTNCKYKVILTSTEDISFFVIVSFLISGEVQQISNTDHYPTLGLISSQEPACYSYPISNELKSENLIISLTSFSGALNKLYLNPWNKIDKNSLNSSKMNFSLDEEEYIKITPLSRSVNGVETGDLFICIDSNNTIDSSFFMKVMPEGKIEEFQLFNYIINGKSLIIFRDSYKWLFAF